MGSVLCCECEANATDFALLELRRRLEGQTKVVQPDPRIDPKIHVTFLEVNKKDGGSVRFSPLKFTLCDLVFRTSCLIEGTKAQLMGAAAVKGVHAGAKKVGVDAGSKAVWLAGKAVAAAEMAEDAISMKSATERTIKVDVTVDLVKELDVEEVAVKIKDFHTDVVVAEKVLKVKVIRDFVERAISAKASEIATRMAREKTNRVLSKFQCCP